MFSRIGNLIYRSSESKNSASYVNRQSLNLTLDPSGTDFIEYSTDSAYFTDAHSLIPNSESQTTTTALKLQDSATNNLFLSTLGDFTLCVKHKLNASSTSTDIISHYFDNPQFDISFAEPYIRENSPFNVIVSKASNGPVEYEVSGNLIASDLSNGDISGTLSTVESVLPYTLNTGTGGNDFVFSLKNLDVSLNAPIYSQYYVTSSTNILGETVFAFSPTGTEGTYNNQLDLSFGANSKMIFNVSDNTMTDFSLVFGTTVDDINTRNESVVTRTNDLVILDISAGYDGDRLVYFEDSSAGMGYVASGGSGNTLIESNFTNTSAVTPYITSIDFRSGSYNFSFNDSPYTFANGDYTLAVSSSSGHGNIMNTIDENDAISQWHWSGGAGTFTNSIYNGSESLTIDGVSYSGDWIEIKMPYRMVLKSLLMGGRQGNARRYPKVFYMVGSNDGGSTYEHIETITTDLTGVDTSTLWSLTISFSPTTKSYQVFRMMVNELHPDVGYENTDTNPQVNIGRWALTGDVVEVASIENYTVDVSNNSVFRLDSGDGNGFVEKPAIDFTNNSGTTYIFDQSHESNANNTLVIGTAPDISSSIVSSGLTIMGTPGQPGAYTKYVSNGSTVYYFSYQTENMGEEPLTYTVKVVDHEITGEKVFSIQAPGTSTFINQPDLSFGAGDRYQFDVTDDTMADISLVFGTTVDDSTSINESVVTRYEGMILLDISAGYDGDRLVYFEDSSAGMGYVSSSSSSGSGSGNTNIVPTVLWYNFDISDGNTIANDATGSSLGGAVMTRSSIVTDVSKTGTGSLLCVRDAGQKTQYVTLPSLTLPSDFTMCFWHKMEQVSDVSFNGNIYLLYFMGVNTNAQYTDQYAIEIEVNKGNFEIILNHSAGETRYDYGTYPNDNAWHHLMFIKSATEFKVYIDNSEKTPDKTVNMGTFSTSTYNSHYISGRDDLLNGTANFHMGGHTDDYRFYSIALDDTERDTVYNYAPTQIATYTVDVSNNSVFRLDSGDGNGFVEKPAIDFTNNSGTTYIFDQSDSTNANNTLIIGTAPDVSSSIVSSGLTIMGTPGQAGAYTKYVSDGSTVYYFSYQTENMGEEPSMYTVKVVDHEITGEKVFSIQAPGTSTFINQPDLSFGAGDRYQFDVTDDTMADISLVFGTTVDDSTSINESVVTRYEGMILLDISAGYDGGRLVYFEDSSSNMGYVASPPPVFTYGAKFEPEFYTDANSNNINGTALNNLADSTKNATISTSGTGSLTYYENISGRKCYFLSQSNCSIDLPSNLLSDTSSFSFSAFYYVVYSEVNTYAQLYGCGDLYKSVSIGTATQDSNGIPGPQVKKNTGIKINMSGTTPYETWYHICVTHNGTTNKTILYLDGVEVGSDDTEALNMVQPIKIGFSNAPYGGFYIDAVSVYDKVLTANEVSNLSGSNIVKVVTVSNGAFVIDGVSKDNITFTNGQTYVFDQSDDSNANNTLVIGSFDVSSSIVSSGLTIMGTPGQPGAYTKYVSDGSTVHYFSYQTENMGTASPPPNITDDLYVHYDFELPLYDANGTAYNTDVTGGSDSYADQSIRFYNKAYDSITNSDISYNMYVIRGSLVSDPFKVGSRSFKTFESPDKYGASRIGDYSFRLNSTQGYSICFWMKEVAKNYTASQFLPLCAFGNSSGGGGFFQMEYNDSTFKVNNNGINITYNISSLTITNWNHIAFTMSPDGPDITWKLYINGSLVNTKTELTNYLTSVNPVSGYPTDSVWIFDISAKPGGGGNNGFIDDFRFYKTELSQAQVSAVYSYTG